MLKIIIGHHKNEIYNTDVYYENQYLPEWTMSEFAQKVIKNVDCSEVVGPDEIKNELFGIFKSTELSAGAKTLLLLYNQPKKIFNISNCGENCVPYILEITKSQEITVCLHHFMDFGDDFELKVINEKKNRVITDPEEYLFISHKYLKGTN